MARFGRGLICLTLTRERCERLQLPPMARATAPSTAPPSPSRSKRPNGVTTGISAADRARTVQAAVARDAKASDLVQPGHIFPLQAQDGGVLMRAGHTEAGCDLAAMAGLAPAAVICEVMKDDGTMARLPDLEAFAARARPEDRHHRRPDRAPQPQRIADRACRRAHAAHAAGRVRLHRLPRPHRRPAPGADARPLGRGATRCWCACTSRCRCWTCSTPARATIRGRCRARWRRCTRQRARRGRAAQLRRGRRGAAAALLARGRGARRADAARWTCAPTASARRSCATSASRRMKLLGSPRRMPSMTGYGLEVTGFVAASRRSTPRRTARCMRR